MASSAPAAATLLEALPARPPTPPREANHAADVSLKSVLDRTTTSDPSLSLQTPPSANSAAPDSTAGSSRSRKKVEWSAHTEYKEAPDYRQGGQLAKCSPASAPSSASSKPIKGILKPSSSPNPLASAFGNGIDGPVSQANITEMLDSTIQQLAGPDRDSRLDAYMMLARALKASNNLPDRVALQDKMSLFMQFIHRDVTFKSTTGLDTSLINHALNLLITFLHFPAIASTLNFDFGVFLIDHAIRCFKDSSIPKDIVRHLMQVVAFQNFSPKIMTADRVVRLLAALHQIEDHLTGKSIVMSRIQIYKRLVKQSRLVMATNSDWLMDMFTDMLSSIKDIRAQAISLGTEAGFSLRSEKLIMRRVSEILETSNEEGEAYIDFYIRRLEELVKDKQSSSVVPDIWGVVILFLRCPLERWRHYGPWLRVVQSAFNTADNQTRQGANHAWNRYVYLCLEDGKMTQKMLSTLRQPLLSQLRRKFNAKQPEEALKLRRTVMSGACNLFYYIYKPSNPKLMLDVAWEHAVQPLLGQLMGSEAAKETQSDGHAQACRMLVGLLDVTTPRVWREDRIMDMPPVKADELPSIDSKWVRRQCDQVFTVAGPLLEKKFADLANKESLTYRLWQALVSSIAAASNKDIKVSEDTAKFFASAFGLLSKVWSKGCAESGDSSGKFLAASQNFVKLLVDNLGMLPFTEKRLSMTVANTFEPIATPSQRSDGTGSSQGVVRVPIHHLFSMLSSTPPGVADNEDFSNFFLATFEPFLKGRPTKAQKELVRDFLQLVPEAALCPYGPWVLAAHYNRLHLEAVSASITSTAENKVLGPEYREVTGLLERGLRSHPNLPSELWLGLFEPFSAQIVEEVGHAGRAIVLIEPLAKLLAGLPLVTETQAHLVRIEATRAVVDAAILPRDKQAVEAARRRLWGTPAAANKSASLDPYDHLYTLGNNALQKVYESSGDTILLQTSAVITAVKHFLTRCLPQLHLAPVSRLRDGISVWLCDEKAHLVLGGDTPLSLAIQSLWDEICKAMTASVPLNKAQRDFAEPLLTAAFKSRRRFIVNRAAEAWNILVKDEERLDYSHSLVSLLSSLRSKVDLHLPGVEVSDQPDAQAPTFLESQEELGSVVNTPSSASAQPSRPLAPVTANSSAASRAALSKKRRRDVRDATPEVVLRKNTRQTSTPRLRHDNSQIQFAPIASSSPLVEESQNLTEHQKEVRERQKATAALYSDIQSSSPAPQEKVDIASAPAEDVEQKATPERNTSYEDMISSTPTPRRGQVLQIEDYNDPPSSPPEPRPYPLLSEIQLRSRASSSLDNWEFSSPPGTPVPSRQQVSNDVEAPALLLTDTSTQREPDASHEEAAVDHSAQSMDVIPSSIVSEQANEPADKHDAMDIDVYNDQSEQHLPQLPVEPPAAEESQEPEAATSVKPTKRASSRVRTRARAKNTTTDQPEERAPEPAAEIQTPVAESIAENDAGQAETRTKRKRSARFRQAGAASSAEVEECIMVSSSPAQPPRQQRARHADMPIIPSTPVQPEEVVESGSRTRKRKRSSRQDSESQRKKLRSTDSQDERIDISQDIVPSQVESQSQPSSPEKAAVVPRRGPGRPRRSSRKAQESQESQALEAENAGADNPAPAEVAAPAAVDEGDTDEELMSQLVTESNAASQSQPEPENEPAPVKTAKRRRRSTRSQVAETAVKPDVEPAPAPVESSVPVDEAALTGETIMDKLRFGLDGLRQAALSRADVYKIEDMLMDMKRELFEAERRGRNSV